LDNDADASGKKLWQWLGDVEFVSQDGVMPPIFSTQLEDWEAFRQKWQWDNRSMYASHDGLAAFLESRKKRYLHKGESKVVSDSSFKEIARHIWNYERGTWSCLAERASSHTNRRLRDALGLINSRKAWNQLVHFETSLSLLTKPTTTIKDTNTYRRWENIVHLKSCERNGSSSNCLFSKLRHLRKSKRTAKVWVEVAARKGRHKIATIPHPVNSPHAGKGGKTLNVST
jgi:hypothetical protein